ncbi:MAG: methanethiol oxidase [Bryobacterales bacterium]|nr:methanethiol oxidase [Bryobacterales bacterium]
MNFLSLVTAGAVCATLLAGLAPAQSVARSGAGSPYLFLFAGDQDGADSDFLAVVDLRVNSPNLGKVIATTPVGLKSSMPHHMEYQTPPKGELLFMNAHHPEVSLLVDVSDPRAPRVVKTFAPPAPLRYPHDYYRTPTGTRLVGFLRSEGTGPDPGETARPGNHGGIAEYTSEGRLLRQVSAAIPNSSKSIRPYAFALLPEIDRLVVTSACMMESTWADVVQVYRYSDFTLLKTIDLPPGHLKDGREMKGSQSAGFGPRVLADRSVFFNAYGCAFYRLTDIGSQNPRLDTIFTLETPEVARGFRGSCGIPVVFGKYWLMPVGQLHAVVVLDISNPAAPREVSRLRTPATFNPHWLARDARSNRLVLGAELGGEEGFFLLRFDAESGGLSFDPAFKGEGQTGYLSLRNQSWPHGPTGPAWGHAALFLPQQ